MEFSNDGVRDSLTQSLAPNIFLELLERESAISDRENREISVIIAQCQNVDQGLQYNLRALNSIIKIHIRRDEFYSRSIHNGFWFFVRGDKKAAEKIIDRMENSISSSAHSFAPNTQISFTTLERTAEQKHLDWVSEIDRKSFPLER